MKRFLSIIIAVALAVTMLAACGDSGNGTHVNPEDNGSVGGAADNSADNQLPADDGQSNVPDSPIDDSTEPEVTEPEVTEPEVTDAVPQGSGIDYNALSEEEKELMYITQKFWEDVLKSYENYGEESLQDYNQKDNNISYCSGIIYYDEYDKYLEDRYYAVATLLANHADYFAMTIDSDTFNKTSMEDLPYPGGWEAYYGEYETIFEDLKAYRDSWYTDFTFDNGKLTVRGIGEMDGSAWKSQADLITEVVIEPGFTAIGESAFSYCYNLTSVTISDTITSIGESAFNACKNLTDVTIPNSVTEIGDYAFHWCGFYSITIPDSVTSIGNEAFSDCYNLTGVTIPDSVTSIGRYAFSRCDSLTDLTISASVTEMEQYVFCGCKSLSSVTIPNGVTIIGNYAFTGCEKLTSVTIPGSVDKIHSDAFRGCTKLTSVIIQEGVKTIGDSAFLDCSSLISVVIPASVTKIEMNAFKSYYDAEPLAEVYYGGTAAEWNKLISNSEETGIPPLTCKIHYESTGPTN